MNARYVKLLPYIFLGISVLIITVIGVLPVHVDKNAPSAQQYLIISSPWSLEKEAINIAIQSDGHPIDEGAFSFMVIVSSDRADFIHNAYKHGAFLVLNPVIKGGCFRRTFNQFTKV